MARDLPRPVKRPARHLPTTSRTSPEDLAKGVRGPCGGVRKTPWRSSGGLPEVVGRPPEVFRPPRRGFPENPGDIAGDLADLVGDPGEVVDGVRDIIPPRKLPKTAQNSPSRREKSRPEAASAGIAVRRGSGRGRRGYRRRSRSRCGGRRGHRRLRTCPAALRPARTPLLAQLVEAGVATGQLQLPRCPQPARELYRNATGVWTSQSACALSKNTR